MCRRMAPSLVKSAFQWRRHTIQRTARVNLCLLEHTLEDCDDIAGLDVGLPGHLAFNSLGTFSPDNRGTAFNRSIGEPTPRSPQHSKPSCQAGRGIGLACSLHPR